MRTMSTAQGQSARIFIPVLVVAALIALLWREMHTTQTLKQQSAMLSDILSEQAKSSSATRELAAHKMHKPPKCPEPTPCNCPACNCPAVSSLVQLPGVQERQASGHMVYGVKPEQVGKPDTVKVIPNGQLGTFDEFLLELKAAIDVNLLPDRPIMYVMSDRTSQAYPYCQGQWLEFGVASGLTINHTADYRRRVCGNYSAPVAGFDTFTGLPEAWGDGEWANQFKQGQFSLGGNFPRVQENVVLVKGLFSESLPPFLSELDKSSGGTPSLHTNVTFLHIDCDLYAGARDALQILNDRIHPGCILIFDELLHIPKARDFEVKAMYEWLQYSGRRVQVIGMLGNLQTKDGKVDLDVKVASHAHQQSVAFVVL